MILYPPDHEGPTPNGWKGNEWEWNASQLKKGDVCWFRYRKQKLWLATSTITYSEWTRGTFLYSYDYDGIIAGVYEDDPDDLIKHSLFLGAGDQIQAVKP